MRQDNIQSHKQAAQAVARGGIVAFRTDTFYGLGVDPFNRAALGALKALKGRDEGKPILVVISDAAQVARFLDGEARLLDALAASHWPGALTLVVRARVEVPDELTAGTRTIGIRLPDDAEVRALVGACGGALTATSANPAGQPPARTAAEVARYFPHGIELILDGGEARTDSPSTVLDITGDAARLIREGVITRQELQKTLRTLNTDLL
ncbi:MAG TPA: L-threonylcarbamoyladenylate synthase [Pyrinomonadaceae bacterium]|nr:L-threonylcarbamoyladenylate synthase [Pyrinomonadaceae bacterium]